MCSLGIINSYPVFIWKQIGVEVVSNIWIAILIDFGVRSQCLAMCLSIFALDYGKVFFECLIPDACIFNLKVETA